MKKITTTCKRLMLSAMMLAAFSFNANAKDVVLKAGTAVPLQLVNTIDGSHATVGQVVDFRVTSDVVADGVTVIPAGTLAKAQVTRAKKNRLFGGEGEIALSINSVTAVDGSQVVLSGATLADEGKSKLVVAILLCWLIKGEAGELAAGMNCNASVAGNTTISVK